MSQIRLYIRRTNRLYIANFENFEWLISCMKFSTWRYPELHSSLTCTYYTTINWHIDFHRLPPTSADFRHPPTSTDLRRLPPTSDLRRLPPTSADFHRLPTSADFHRPPPTSTDFRPPPTSTDLRRLPPTSTDLRRLPPTSADFHRPPPTGDNKRDASGFNKRVVARTIQIERVEREQLGQLSHLSRLNLYTLKWFVITPGQIKIRLAPLICILRAVCCKYMYM